VNRKRSSASRYEYVPRPEAVREWNDMWHFFVSVAWAAETADPVAPYLMVQFTHVISTSEFPRAGWIKATKAWARTHDVEGLFEVREGSREPTRYGDLQSRQLAALRVMLQVGAPDTELDLVVEDGGEHWPVTARWGADDSLEVEAGARPMPPPHEVEDAGILLDRWPLGELSEGEHAPWDSRTLGLIDEAFTILDAHERAMLAGLSFQRKASASVEVKRLLGASPVALYASEPRDGFSVQLYNIALGEETTFVGRVDQPHRFELYTLMHELGHALAHAQLRNQLAPFQESLGRLFALSSRRDRGLSPAETRTVDAEMTAAVREIRSRGGEPEALVALIDAELASPSAVERALQAALGEQPAPTTYARTDPSEAFAECFALFKLDPDALGRAAPRVLEWFQSGQHAGTPSHSH
jgi:hypothetical protein